jgi:hypothetical protein
MAIACAITIMSIWLLEETAGSKNNIILPVKAASSAIRRPAQ